MTDIRYIARISDRNGKRLYTSDIHYTREDAAREAFAARPNTTRCSTSRATQMGIGDWRDYGFDIRWITRYDLERAEDHA